VWAYAIDSAKRRFLVSGKEYTLPGFWAICAGCGAHLDAGEIDVLLELKAGRSTHLDPYDRQIEAESVSTFVSAALYRRAMTP
jgi:hypothetical protein